MKFDRKKFFDGIRNVPTISPTNNGAMIQSQVDGLNFLLDAIERAGSRFETLGQVAYFFATVAHECRAYQNLRFTGSGEVKRLLVSDFKPIREFGNRDYFTRYDGRSDLGNIYVGDGFRFRGRGFVQNTGRRNAELTGKALAGTIITNADVTSCDQAVREAFTRATHGRGDYFTVFNETFLVEPELLLVPRISFLDAVDGMLTGRYTGKPLFLYVNHHQTDYVNARRVVNGTDKAQPIAIIAGKIEAVLKSALVAEEAPVAPIRTTVAFAPDPHVEAEDNFQAPAPPVPPPHPAQPGNSAQPAVSPPQQGSALPQPIAVNHLVTPETSVVNTPEIPLPTPPAITNTAASVVSTPGDAPMNVLGGLKDKLMPALGWLSTAGAGVTGIMKDNTKLMIALGALAFIALVIGGIYKIVIDRERLRINADPTKYNVK